MIVLLALAQPGLGIGAVPVLVQAQVPAQAQEKRIALVIGNARYRDMPLNNPEADARLVAARLRSLRFEVNEQLNLGVREFRRLVREFARRVQHDEAVAVLYYAGHGVQIDGRNYLLPVDINLRDEEEIKDESVDIDELYISRLDKARSKARIVILDACRDNPFVGKTRNVRTSAGLAEMAARGTLIAFSSAPGAPAEDGAPGTNSVYTRHLADEMMVEALEVEQMFKKVRVKVLRDTKERQIPWVNTSLTANFSFNPGRGISADEQARQEQIGRLQAELAQTREALAKARAAAVAPATADPATQPNAPSGAAPGLASRPSGGRADDDASPDSIGQLKAQADRSRHALGEARAELSRQEALVRQGKAGAAGLAVSRERVAQAEARLDAARDALIATVTASAKQAAAQLPIAAGAAPSAASKTASGPDAAPRPRPASAPDPDEFDRLEAQLERVRSALEEARSRSAAVHVVDVGEPPQAAPDRPERALRDARRADRTHARQCADLLQRASIGIELRPEQQAFLRMECRP